MSAAEIDIILMILNEKKKYKIKREDVEQVLDWLNQ
jgi:hypothetical protein